MHLPVAWFLPRALAPGAQAQAPSYALPQPAHPDAPGRGVQRTMTLLATSTPSGVRVPHGVEAALRAMRTNRPPHR